jgi:hypothetical protein
MPYEIQDLLLVGLLTSFGLMVVLNIYFRVRVMVTYRRLSQSNVRFEPKHVFQPKLMEAEVLPLYPEHRDDIVSFSRHLRLTIRMASVLIALVTLFGGVLLYYR